VLEVADIVRLHGAAYREQWNDLEPRSKTGAPGYCRLPYAVLWRPCLPVRSLPGKDFLLPLLPKSLLPEVSPKPDRTLAESTALPPAALFLFPGDLHAAGAVASTGPLAPKKNLWSADEGRRRCASDSSARSFIPRRPRRRLGRSSHLDARHAVSSLCPHARHCRRSRSGWAILDPSPTPTLPGSRSCTVGDLSRQVLRRSQKGRTASIRSNPVWKIRWVVHSQHAGRGDKVLDYLARYVFRIAIVNSRLESLDNGIVGFRYRDNKTHQIRHVKLPATEFIHQFLQHVLPKGATKVRYYGIFSPACTSQLDRARKLWTPLSLQTTPPTAPDPEPSGDVPALPPPSRCPHCHVGFLLLLETLLPQRSRSP
jgi:hypothetical protein